MYLKKNDQVKKIELGSNQLAKRIKKQHTWNDKGVQMCIFLFCVEAIKAVCDSEGQFLLQL